MKSPERNVSTARWLLGMAISAVFSFVFLLSPVYIFWAVICLVFQYPSREWAFLFAAPMLVSMFFKSTPAPALVGKLSPMLDYFDYHEEFELTDEEIRVILKTGKKFILAFQPHGVISFVGFCAGINAPEDLRCIKTAVASILLKVPILKHVLGIFGLIDASASSMRRHFKNDGIDGCIVLYVGGIAELFKSSRKEERIYLSGRKGFIKVALREGVDVVPAYLFGNTSVLTVWKFGPLAALSRRLQTSVTYYWGKFYLPIPRDETLIYARGKPLGLPHIPEPTQEDVDKWHEIYCKEVTALFDKYKEKCPMYKHKTLFID